MTGLSVESPTGASVDVETEGDGAELLLRIGAEDVDVTGRQTSVIAYPRRGRHVRRRR